MPLSQVQIEHQVFSALDRLLQKKIPQRYSSWEELGPMRSSPSQHQHDTCSQFGELRLLRQPDTRSSDASTGKCLDVSLAILFKKGRITVQDYVVLTLD
jgi:hypothetical protein